MPATTKHALPEPWLRGTHGELPAVVRAVIHAIELADENTSRWWALLREDELSARPFNLTPISFQMRHMARSLDRLLTYAEGKSLEENQLAGLDSELTLRVDKAEALAEFSTAIREAKERVRAFSQSNLETERAVGRKQLPTTVGGLLVHIADHTQRHTGQLVTTAKLVIAMRKNSP
jgi:DinB superfamily